jgi:hypothetical protein
MAKYFLLLVLVTGCSVKKEYNTVNIHIDPESYGWHFIELQKAGPKENWRIADVKFDSGVYLQSAVVSDFDAVDYNVLDPENDDISFDMKLPDVISHSNKKTYFTFYNPTPEDMEAVKHWLPDNAEYDRIMRMQKEALDTLTN